MSKSNNNNDEVRSKTPKLNYLITTPVSPNLLSSPLGRSSSPRPSFRKRRIFESPDLLSSPSLSKKRPQQSTTESSSISPIQSLSGHESSEDEEQVLEEQHPPQSQISTLPAPTFNEPGQFRSVAIYGVGVDEGEIEAAFYNLMPSHLESKTCNGFELNIVGRSLLQGNIVDVKLSGNNDDLRITADYDSGIEVTNSMSSFLSTRKILDDEGVIDEIPIVSIIGFLIFIENKGSICQYLTPNFDYINVRTCIF